MNFVRSVVEASGSLFKEVDLRHDFGHDGTILVVVDGRVQPREVAVQIKAGMSYITAEGCRLPATAEHIEFWAEHDLVTIGVVFDPVEQAAWWINLKDEARAFRTINRAGGTSFRFAKAAWNAFNEYDFPKVVLPTLLGRQPDLPLDRALSWARAENLELHDRGVCILRARHSRLAEAWNCLIDGFQSRPIEQLTLNTPLGLSMLLGHDDIGYYPGQIPASIRAAAAARVLAFGAAEIEKLLALLPEDDFNFDRPSFGYSLLPLLGKDENSLSILRGIRDKTTIGASVRERAAFVVDWYEAEPDWWRFWRRDRTTWILNGSG